MSTETRPRRYRFHHPCRRPWSSPRPRKSPPSGDTSRSVSVGVGDPAGAGARVGATATARTGAWDGGPYWGGPWGWGGGWGWGPGPYAYDYPYAQARIQILPKDAEVFVDGYRAGIVDDFDGVLQRLNVWPGEHEITIFLDGYKTEHHKLYFNNGSTANLKGTMEKLGAGEKSEPPPQPEPRQQPQQQQQQDRRVAGAACRCRCRSQPNEYITHPETTVAVEQPATKFGGVSVKVLPTDAEVRIDDQAWPAPTGDSRLNVQLQVGRHHVEVRKDGFTTYSEDVLIRAGGTLTLNISLTKK